MSAKILKFTAATAGLVAASILKCFVLAAIWNWYMVPAFGFAPLRPIYAYGLSVFLAYSHGGNSVENDKPMHEKILGSMVLALMVLFFTWLGTFFI